MYYKLVVSQDAHNSLDVITQYIVNELQAPRAAAKLKSSIQKAFELIAVTPEVYKRVKFKNRYLRVFYVNNFNIFYTIDSKKEIVSILNIIYGKRDISKCFSG